MYRVELKVEKERELEKDTDLVPNVPCGVERNSEGQQAILIRPSQFLMYRVELKELPGLEGQTDVNGS